MATGGPQVAATTTAFAGKDGGMITDRGHRVVVTGMDIVSPVGHGVSATWDAISGGVSGITNVTRCETDDLETRFAGEVSGFDPETRIERKLVRRMDRFSWYAVGTALGAVEDAGLTMADLDQTRVAVIIGTAMGGIETIEAGAMTIHQKGPRRLSPFFVPMLLPNMAAGNVAIALGAQGSNFAPTSACASSAHALGEAMRLIQRGDADVVIAGGSEAPIARLAIAGFNAMGALSTRNDDPTGASRPFDLDRDGFVMGEGAATLVLESFAHARSRGARPLAELAGYGSTDDANHIVQPAPGGVGAARAMSLALADAGLAPNQIGYVNAHGTSTRLNEELETLALRRVFDERLPALPVSSTKSMTGHLLGAAGAVEAVISIKAMETGCLPPTINYQTPDPACDLDVIPNQARKLAVDAVMSNSLGFGGHNVSLIFTRLGSLDDEPAGSA